MPTDSPVIHISIRHTDPSLAVTETWSCVLEDLPAEANPGHWASVVDSDWPWDLATTVLATDLCQATGVVDVSTMKPAAVRLLEEIMHKRATIIRQHHLSGSWLDVRATLGVL